MRAFFEPVLKASKMAWVIFCCLVVLFSVWCWIDALGSLITHSPNGIAAIGDALRKQLADYVSGRILEKIFDTFSNSLCLLVSSTIVGIVYIRPVLNLFRQDVIGVPKQIDNFFRPLEKALNDAAKIEVNEVEMRARAVLDARARTMTHISGLYCALWFGFNELEDVVGPDGSPPVNVRTERIPIESNLKCETCGGPMPCDCRGGAYVEARKIEAEKRGESLMRIRAALDRLTSQRRALRHKLDSELKHLLSAVRAAKDYKEPKSREERFLEFIQATGVGMICALLLLSLAVFVQAVLLAH